MRWAAWIAALAALVAAACNDSKPAARKPDVVLILVDTLRPDHLQAYGYERETSPFLAELASRGVLFERAYSASTWTAPATASLFTGLYPNQHGVTEGFFVHRARLARDGAEQANEAATVSLNRLPDAAPTAPELFKAAGYATFGVSCNVNITERIGFHRGFEHFADFTGPKFGKGAPAEHALAQLRQWKPLLDADGPYFLYLHFNDVHAPWTPRSPAFAPDAENYGGERASYDAEIRHLDAQLRQMHAELGWNDDTLIVLVSDHGEEFGEHGALGHGYSVHSELMRVAMLFSWPAQIAGGRRVETPASLVDVLPTLAQLAGLDTPKLQAGRSLAPVLAGKAMNEERTLFALRFKEGGARQLWAAQRGRWKLILAGKGPRLYDHESDPFEQRDVAAQHPEVVASLMDELRAFRANTRPIESGQVDVELDTEALRALEQLGYTDRK